MNTKQILEDLDKHASEFNFPVLDNEYVEFAAARLSAFRAATEWLLVFEVLGFSTREVEFVNDLYAFGSCVEAEGFISEEIPVKSTATQPLFDSETRECIADLAGWAVKIGKEEIFFSPSFEEYAKAGIACERESGPGSLTEIELLRFLVYRLGERRLFMSDEALLSHFPACRNLEKLAQTTEWQHPNIAQGEKPSRNISLITLVEALSKTDPLLFKQGCPNTNWRFWSPGPK